MAEATKSLQSAPPPLAFRAWLNAWPLLLGFAVLAVPTFKSLGSQVWSQESGAHGPIILATGVWLLWRQTASLPRNESPGSQWAAALLLAGSLAIYVFGRAYDFISLETAGLYGVAVSFFLAHFGAAALIRNWFPILYLGFAVPPPGWLIDSVTAPLKQFVSMVSTESLHAVGIPISREGVTIYVAEYQLLVEDACSGMNSLVGLIAISLFYIYLLHGSSLRYSLVLLSLVVPIAIIGNIIRIMILILLTYFYGDAVAQGYLHFTAGFLLFVIALSLVFASDRLLARILPRSWRPA
jgi:exosortase